MSLPIDSLHLVMEALSNALLKVNRHMAAISLAQQ